MKSQVSFRFDGSHNTSIILQILRKELKGFVYSIEQLNECTYRIYVASKEDIQKTFNACFGIQCFCVYDDTKEI